MTNTMQTVQEQIEDCSDRKCLLEQVFYGIINSEEQLFLSALKNEKYRASILAALYKKEGAHDV